MKKPSNDVAMAVDAAEVGKVLLSWRRWVND